MTIGVVDRRTTAGRRRCGRAGDVPRGGRGGGGGARCRGRPRRPAAPVPARRAGSDAGSARSPRPSSTRLGRRRLPASADGVGWTSRPARAGAVERAMTTLVRRGSRRRAGRRRDDRRGTGGAACTPTWRASSSRRSDVEWLVDVAAWHGLNRLHLHLTDDEAWRFPVPGYGAHRCRRVARPRARRAGAARFGRRAVRRRVHPRRHRPLARPGGGGGDRDRAGDRPTGPLLRRPGRLSRSSSTLTTRAGP